MQNQSTVTIRRGQIGQWASIIGGTGLLIGLVGLVWQGGLTPFIIGSLIAGGLGLLVWAVISPAEFRGFLTGRQARYGTSAVFGTLLLVGIVALVYVVLQRAVITVDMTEGQRFSLSNETLGVLRRVTRPIRITGFYSPRALQLRAVDDQFFRLYEVATNGLITRQYIDPDEQPALAQRFNVPFDGAVYLSYVNDDGSIDFSSVARLPRSENQERDTTQAIARLLIAGTLTVYFDQSLGELDPLQSDQQGLSAINGGIQESGLITQPIDLVTLAQSRGNIPANASALILARPVTDLNDAQIAVIDRYLKNGGALFIMTDVLFTPDAFLRQNGNFNQYLWENYGLRALDAAVIDPASSTETALDVVSAAIFPDNAIAARMDQENSPSLFKLARVIEVGSTLPPDTSNGRVVMSSPQSWGETNLVALGDTNTYTFEAGQDIQGPLTMVAWAFNQRSGAKVLMVGDSDFVTNGLVLTGGNSLLFTDGLAWLTGLGEQINYTPQVYSSGLPVLFVSGDMLDAIGFLTVFVMPAGVLALGLIVWARRGRA